MSFKHSEIDEKWQVNWAQSKVFEAEDLSSKPKYYTLVMFPYPSGYGLHAGHLAAYVPADVVSRYKRARGFNVLQPFGYDAFGLPAEQFAIQTGKHPAEITKDAIENFRRQVQSFGISFDWSREVTTCEPSYYKWTQYIFIKLFERGLAYQKEVPVNWCPELKTVLANDEVVDGKSERGGHPVVRMPMKQWVLKITDYADRLLEDLDSVDWPQRTKDAQKNWIGKSVGATVQFDIPALGDLQLEVFTTRPDTLYGVTFMVLAPEHPLVEKVTTDENRAKVQDYVQSAASKSDIDRQSWADKTGVDTGGVVTHPLTGKSIPVWVADYVLMDYGTGAIMAVPGHDERDFEFAKAFGIDIVRVLDSGSEKDNELPFTGSGQLVNSDFLNGLNKTEAIAKMTDHLESNQLGKKRTQFKLRDWIFSRQRYWGEPFPMLHSEGSEVKPVPAEELPVELPPVPNYQPTEDGSPPLANATDWVNYSEKVKRDTDTMPGAAGSSWYFLRYTDPQNQNQPFDFEKQKYWMPVDFYLGGAEHTVGHLLYSRFWHKVLFDEGLVSHPEPYQKLAHQGMILGADGEKMSKSRGNTVNVDDLREKFGADAVRTYILFLGPLDRDKPWATNGIEGVKRFLDRTWRLVVNEDGTLVADDTAPSGEIEKTLHKTIKKVSDDIESHSFNTAISQMMILVNDMYKAKCHSRSVLLPLSQLLMPFAPHFAEEIWQKLGGEGLAAVAPWPEFDAKKVIDDVITMGVQVNGKMRGTIEIAPDATEEVAVAKAQELDSVNNALAGKSLVKTIYRAGRILNLIGK